MQREKNDKIKKGIPTVKNELFSYEVSTSGDFVLSDKWSIPYETEQMKRDYHKQRLWQSKMAFGLSFGGSIVGFIVIVASVVYGMVTGNDQWPGIVSGITVEAVSALFYTLSNKANEKIRDLNLTPQQWDTVDAAITAENISSIEYIRIAYKQGIIDAFSILR